MADPNFPRLIFSSPVFDARDRLSRMRIAERSRATIIGPEARLLGSADHIAPALNVLEQSRVPYTLDAHPEFGFKLRRLPLYKGTPKELSERRDQAIRGIIEALENKPIAVVVARLTSHLPLYQVEALAGPAPEPTRQ